MATDERWLTFQTQDDTNFRAWGQGISNALQACGLVKHTDGGQIDWATATTASGALNIAGYEMFRFSDALQGNSPVFVKVEYGVVSSSGTSVGRGTPVVFITVGNATNSAGTLTGVVSQRQPLMTGGSGSWSNGGGTASAPTPVWTCGDGSGICMVIGAQSQARQTVAHTGVQLPLPMPAMLVIERSRDSGGVANGDGLLFAISTWTPSIAVDATAPTSSSQFLSFLGSNASAVGSQWPINWPMNGWGVGVSGPDLYSFPLRIVTPKPQWGLAVLGIYKGDVALGTTVLFFHMGANRTYRSLAGIAGVASNDNTRSYVSPSVPAGALMMRWE